jgi:uncharacterized membrane protein
MAAATLAMAVGDPERLARDAVANPAAEAAAFANRSVHVAPFHGVTHGNFAGWTGAMSIPPPPVY